MQPDVALPLAFFLSGVAALLFETLWFRLCGLALGNSIWSSSTVLAAFMSGLALGNGLAARVGHRIERPVRAYAAVECVIAATGLTLVTILPLVTPLLAPLLGALTSYPFAVHAIRLSVAFFLMLVPTTAMGLTLPLLAAALSRTDKLFGRVLGRLYGWNTLGGVAGALLGETYLIGSLGVRGTAASAAAFSLLAAVIALRGEASSTQAAPVVVIETAKHSRRRVRLLAMSAFLAGALLLALEVIWFRFLLLFAFGSSFLFALMLATVLAGIGIGGCLGGYWLGRCDGAQRWAGLIAVGVGLMTVVSYWSYARPADSLPSFLWYSWLVARLMLPAALFSGVLFTLLGRALRDEFDHETRAAGILTLSNTLGAMIGAPLAAIVLLPSLGIEASLFLVSLSYTVVAIAFALADRPPLRRRRWLTLGAAAAFIAIMAFFPFGLMRNRFYPQVLRTFLDGDTRLVAFREGLCETIGYLRTDWWGTPAYFRLITNSYSMSATTFHSKRYMKLFVYWAVAARPDARKALLVSYGVGMTADALTRTRSLEKIDVVDISPDILAMSDVVFGGHGRGPLSDPRVRVHVDDGRFFLQTTGERYDIITSEPPPPRGAGVVNLYSREYFELMRARLNPGGVVTYWLPVGQLPLSESSAVTIAFCQAFPDCSLWNGGGYDWILAGVRAGGAPVTEEGFTRQWNDPRVRDDLIRIALENPEMLGATFIADADQLARWTEGAAVVDDDHPHRLGQRKAGASDIHYYGALAETIKTRRRFQTSAWIKRFWPAALAERTIAWFDVQRIINERYTKRRYGSQIEDLFRVLTTTQLRTTPLMQLDSYWPLTDIVRDPAMDRVDSPFLDYHRGATAMADRRYGEAARLFARAEQNGSSFEGLFLYKALALALDGRPGDALAALRGSSVDAQVPWIAESRAWLERHLGSQQRLK